MNEQVRKEEHKDHWLARRSTIRMLIWVGLAVLAAVTALDTIIHGHPHFGVDGWFGFYSGYGFLTCAVMVLFAKFLGFFLKRKDTYYDE
ncbi:MAG: hypothetical protein ACLFWF_06790 [Alphaproteobacteria bacterium]